MKRKVLVVDDSEIVLAKASEALTERGFDVSVAISALEADKFIYIDNKPDIIIMDIMMPLLDGDKKAKMLKEDGLTCHIPILLLSSKSREELIRLVKESNSDGFIRKPFTSWQLIKKVEETLADN